MINGLFGKIMGFLIIIITLALGPSINTANAAILNGNTTNLIGLATVGSFGSPLIILGLLVAGGAFALAGARGQMSGATAGTLMQVVGSVIVAIVALTFMTSIVTYVNTLIGAPPVGGFAQVIYGIIPLVIYLGIVGGSGWTLARNYRKSLS